MFRIYVGDLEITTDRIESRLVIKSLDWADDRKDRDRQIRFAKLAAC